MAHAVSKQPAPVQPQFANEPPNPGVAVRLQRAAFEGVLGMHVHALHSGEPPTPGGTHHVALLSQNVVIVAVSLYVKAG